MSNDDRQNSQVNGQPREASTYTMREVGFGIKIVGQGEARKFRQLGSDDFRRRSAIQKLSAHLGEFQIRFAGDDVVGEFHDFLAFSFVADFGAAENDFYFRPDSFYRRNDFRRFRHVPNVNSEAENLRFAHE